MKRLGPALLLTALAGPAAASVAPEAPLANRQLADPAAEARAHALMQTIRCIQCQGQSIADSDAPIAQTMRSEVRGRIAAGEAPEAIRAFLVERYGQWVSYVPPASGAGLLLWIAPVAVLLAALWIAAGLYRGRRAP